MIPVVQESPLETPRIPRESGDDPEVFGYLTLEMQYSPRERG